MRGVDKVRAILEQTPRVMDIRRHRALRSTVWRMAARGDLIEVLPRLYVESEHRHDPSALLRALALWSPDAVVIGRTAWQLIQEETPGLPLHIALPSSRPVPTWVRATRRVVPADFVAVGHGIRCARPAYLAVEAAATDGGEKLFQVLRKGLATADELLPTLAEFHRTPGNSVRKRISDSVSRTLGPLRSCGFNNSCATTDWMAGWPTIRSW